jgi:hypothetical protein
MEGREIGDDDRSMIVRRRRMALALAVLACALVSTGCGGGSSSSQGGTPSSTESSSATPSEGGKSGEPSKEFAGKGPNGELAAAGKESSVEEREAASKILALSFTAREDGDWGSQCGTLTASVLSQLEGPTSNGGKKQTCLQALEARAKQAPKATLENNMVEPLAALRVNGSQAFAFYHGAGGKDYVIPMEKEGGEWKVGALSPQEAP